MSPPRYHCTSCLDGRHVCAVMIPADWPGATATSRCVCRRCCDKRYATRVVAGGHTVKPLVTPERTGRHPGRPVTKWTDDKLRELVALRAKGLTSREVAERVGAGHDVVRSMLVKAKRKGLAAA